MTRKDVINMILKGYQSSLFMTYGLLGCRNHIDKADQARIVAAVANRELYICGRYVLLESPATQVAMPIQ